MHAFLNKSIRVAFCVCMGVIFIVIFNKKCKKKKTFADRNYLHRHSHIPPRILHKYYTSQHEKDLFFIFI